VISDPDQNVESTVLPIGDGNELIADVARAAPAVGEDHTKRYILRNPKVVAGAECIPPAATPILGGTVDGILGPADATFDEEASGWPRVDLED